MLPVPDSLGLIPLGDSVLGGMALPIGTGNRLLLFDQKATGVANLSLDSREPYL